ncbi:MAG: hypothetical protein ACREQY_17010, partial [Candidatus Binatia bacterium]
GVDVAKQVDGGPELDGNADPNAGNPLSRNNPIDLVRDPGSVNGEPNNGRGEALPFTDSCTFELQTTTGGAEAVRRFGLVKALVHEDPNDAASLGDFHSACAEFAECSPDPCPEPSRGPASASFLGLVSSSAGF